MTPDCHDRRRGGSRFWDRLGTGAVGNHPPWRKHGNVGDDEHNSGEKWTDDDVQQLRELAARNTPVGVTVVKLGRTEEAIQSKARSEASV